MVAAKLTRKHQERNKHEDWYNRHTLERVVYFMRMGGCSSSATWFMPTGWIELSNLLEPFLCVLRPSRLKECFTRARAHTVVKFMWAFVCVVGDYTVGANAAIATCLCISARCFFKYAIVLVCTGTPRNESKERITQNRRGNLKKGRNLI
eukprot:5559-Amphidinium_carterae.1